MIKPKTTEEIIENLPPVFKQRIENLSKTDPALLDWEILFYGQTILIISYVQKRIEDELSRSPITFDEYKKTFPLREEMLLWQISCRSLKDQKIFIPELSTKLSSVSLMMARLYFSNHQEDIATLPAGIWLF